MSKLFCLSFWQRSCHVFLSDGDTLPLSQPQSAHGTLVGGSSCPGTPEMRRRQEETLRRLASQVPAKTNLINRAAIWPACHSIFLSLFLFYRFIILSPCFFLRLLLLLICSIAFYLPVLSFSLYSFKHKGLLRLCCLIKYLYAQSLPAQPLDILRALHL